MEDARYDTITTIFRSLRIFNNALLSLGSNDHDAYQSYEKRLYNFGIRPRQYKRKSQQAYQLSKGKGLNHEQEQRVNEMANRQQNKDEPQPSESGAPIFVLDPNIILTVNMFREGAFVLPVCSMFI